MLAALLLKRRRGDVRVVLVERSGAFGGLYRSASYAEGVVFDNGMHILYDTGIAEIDSLIHELLPREDWHELAGNRKDIGGCLWQGKVYAGSPYLDLRHLPLEVKQACMREIEEAALVPLRHDGTLAGYLEARFGLRVAGFVAPVVAGRYGLAADALSWLAARHPAMDRVVLLDPQDMAPVFEHEGLRARLAYADQVHLPVVRPWQQSGWYPKRFGTSGLVEALKARLLAEGVELMPDTQLAALVVRDGRVVEARMTRQGRAEAISTEAVVWTGDIEALRGAVSGHAPVGPKLPPMYQIRLVMPEAPRMGELYHAYGCDAGVGVFRVTNYAAYCPAAVTAMGWPVCAEYWPEAGEGREAALKNVLERLGGYGVVKGAPRFADVVQAPNVYFRLTCEALMYQRQQKEWLKEQSISNLCHAGLMAEEGALLLYEVMRDMHRKLAAL